MSCKFPHHTLFSSARLQGEAALLPQMSSAYGMLGNIDANTGDAQTGWDTDQARPGPPCLMCMSVHVCACLLEMFCFRPCQATRHKLKVSIIASLASRAFARWPQ